MEKLNSSLLYGKDTTNGTKTPKISKVEVGRTPLLV